MKKQIIYGLFTVMLAATTLVSCDVDRVGVGVSVQPDRPVYVRPVAPSPAHVWIEGDWVWTNNRYVWHEGYWAAPRSRRVYVAGSWENRGGRYYWHRGHWR